MWLNRITLILIVSTFLGFSVLQRRMIVLGCAQKINIPVIVEQFVFPSSEEVMFRIYGAEYLFRMVIESAFSYMLVTVENQGAY